MIEFISWGGLCLVIFTVGYTFSLLLLDSAESGKTVQGERYRINRYAVKGGLAVVLIALLAKLLFW